MTPLGLACASAVICTSPARGVVVHAVRATGAGGRSRLTNRSTGGWWQQKEFAMNQSHTSGARKPEFITSTGVDARYPTRDLRLA